MDRAQIPGPRPEVTRDEGLRRASRLTKWVGVGAVALVGALAGFVAQANPGRSSSTAGNAGTPSASGPGSWGSSAAPSGTGSQTGAGASSATIAPPAAAPAPAPAPASPPV